MDTKAKMVVYKGKERKLKDLCKEFGRNRGTVNDRLKRGWSLEAALETDPQPFGIPQAMKGIKGGRKQHLGIRTQFAHNLFELFEQYGKEALEQAVREKVSNPETVLDFVEKYLMRLIPKESNQTLDSPAQKAIITIDVRNNNPPPIVELPQEKIEHTDIDMGRDIQ